MTIRKLYISHYHLIIHRRFLVAYCWVSGDPTSIQARSFGSDGTPYGPSFRVDQDNGVTSTQVTFEKSLLDSQIKIESPS